MSSRGPSQIISGWGCYDSGKLQVGKGLLHTSQLPDFDFFYLYQELFLRHPVVDKNVGRIQQRHSFLLRRYWSELATVLFVRKR